jgi:hypothetical protein
MGEGFLIVIKEGLVNAAPFLLSHPFTGCGCPFLFFLLPGLFIIDGPIRFQQQLCYPWFREVEA